MIRIMMHEELEDKVILLGWSYPIEELDYLLATRLEDGGTDMFLYDKITNRLVECNILDD